ncbi:hypothetical protein N9096_00925 [bacterium]|mgnify:CR=1 FL=1|nr:hypothetical protein [Verrucomicrobiaceae bacterium]MDB2429113.1 hypothetical protein [Akkermansiaceae bacterium]MDB4512517.1 hypothetical protein [bacterium]MDB4730557.1 hypothetical protein [Akkermansiaceae bacterium]
MKFAATDMKLDGCNDDARASLEWTREQLSHDQRKWLGQLPLTAMMGNFVIAHANLIDPEISSIHSPKKKPREFALTGAL